MSEENPIKDWKNHCQLDSNEEEFNETKQLEDNYKTRNECRNISVDLSSSFISSGAYAASQTDRELKPEKKYRYESEEMELDTSYPSIVPLSQEHAGIIDTQRSCLKRPDCEGCKTLKGEIMEKEKTIEELKTTCNELRSEADMNEKKLADFKERMSIEASAEIGCSNIFEDINNPCRESELRKSYEKLKVEWPKYKENVRKRQGDTSDLTKERETVKRMIKNVFGKALTDMEEKKHSLNAVFKISDDSKTVNKKQLHCVDMALQNLQVMILSKNVTHYQAMSEELGRSDQDYLCKFADLCYKQGCLMALHNPPLTLDWNSEEENMLFPPVKLG